MMASPISLFPMLSAGATVEGGVAAAVHEALWRHEPLRTTKSRIEVEMDDRGSVVLRGNVATDILKDMAGRLAASAPGVAAVANELVSDSDLERQAAEALWSIGEAGLCTDSVDLQCRLGAVYLGGHVVAQDRQAAEGLLARVVAGIEALPGVRGVVAEAEIVESAAGPPGVAAPTAAPGGGGEGTVGATVAGQLGTQERLGVWRERAAARDS
ncbi:MAG: BON domain-containing protein [Anaerolineae bacterium]